MRGPRHTRRGGSVGPQKLRISIEIEGKQTLSSDSISSLSLQYVRKRPIPLSVKTLCDGGASRGKNERKKEKIYMYIKLSKKKKEKKNVATT